MAQGYNVGPSRQNPDRDIVVQSGRRVAGQPTPWHVYEAMADSSMLLSSTVRTYPTKREAVKVAESLVSSIGARWLTQG